ncbi:YfiR family protein [Neptunomonas phycophila]|uniref:YfiR family protein n=1 Tax=Neptunomonas phycophila TaxID=1572645 RepID=A0ABT9ESU9_9GAMM|nr:YfiR family protein [Neptunomonas phycophila]MDO6467363.1 YfiR family protein [Neptunomonas phycophila]MDP2522139.1 YfiR family protein [Neptunomonas phycophila]
MMSTLKTLKIGRHLPQRRALPRLTLILLAMLFMYHSTARAEEVSNPLDDIKSVYIFNFLSFIDWPEPQDDHYQLCIVAQRSMYERIAAVVSGEQIEGRPISMRMLEGDIRGCHLVYWQAGMPISDAELAQLKASNALLVSDKNNFISNGVGMVAFETRGRKVRVAMNLTAMENAGFKVSSKLLRVVRIER